MNNPITPEEIKTYDEIHRALKAEREAVRCDDLLACRGKLPDPTPEQAKCSHAKWRKMNPQPRSCVECGLLMWDAGD